MAGFLPWILIIISFSVRVSVMMHAAVVPPFMNVTMSVNSCKKSSLVPCPGQ